MNPGDEIIVTNQDHEANIGAWRKLKETGSIPELDVFSIDTVKNKSAETTWVLRTRK